MTVRNYLHGIKWSRQLVPDFDALSVGYAAVFPAVQPPAATAFQTYREKSHLVPTGAEAQQLIKGSTADIEFFSVAPKESHNDLACR